MFSARQTFAINDDLPIRCQGPVHSGKVRSVYFLSDADSARLIEQHAFDVAPGAPLAVMVISDRLSAFDCLWRAEGGLDGVPGKGAALNAIANHWFTRFRAAGLAPSHILATPHPLVWIVQRARPVRIEAIARQYLTGSMWRSYAAGEREFCGLTLPGDMRRDSRLAELLITPSTKGVLQGLEGVPAQDDVNVSRRDIERHWQAFGFASPDDIAVYERLLVEGFRLIEGELAALDQIFVDTKFEFGYVTTGQGESQLIYMDEVGTPDSSRIWDGAHYREGRVLERSKESFRQALLDYLPDPTVLLDKDRFPERQEVAAGTRLPAEIFANVADTYTQLAERITGQPLAPPQDPRAEIVQVLSDHYGLVR